MTQFVNNIKTTMLLALLVALAGGIGYLIGGSLPFMIMGSLFGGLGSVIAFFYSDTLAVKAMRGQEVDERTAPDLITMVSRLAKNANLPMPKVYICPQEAPNAFATGRSPSKAAVAVTRGALSLLSYDELEGVIAHELAHIKNRDTLTSTIAAVLGGMITQLAWFAMWFGGGGQRDNPLGIVGLILAIILAPIAAALIQMAISRSREYVADADGAEIAGTPHGLSGALRKLHGYSQRIPLEGELPSSNHMFIVQPLSGQSMAKLFSTHPPIEERIRRLESMRV